MVHMEKLLDLILKSLPHGGRFICMNGQMYQSYISYVCKENAATDWMKHRRGGHRNISEIKMLDVYKPCLFDPVPLWLLVNLLSTCSQTGLARSPKSLYYLAAACLHARHQIPTRHVKLMFLIGIGTRSKDWTIQRRSQDPTEDGALN